MTARDIQRSLILDRYRRNFCLPNYTPRNWFECDVFEATPSGYFREYEIKLTRGDFKADTMKAKSKWGIVEGRWQSTESEMKHKMLAQADNRGPTQFYFITPRDMLEPADIPDWAGWMTAFRYPESDRIQLEERKPAPRLHQNKLDPKVLDHARGIAYWRFMGMFLKQPVEAADFPPCST